MAGPDATSYSLLAIGMEGLTLNVQMPPFDEQLIPSLVFKSMALIPSTNEKKVKLSATIAIEINSPLGHQSPLNIQTIDMKVSLLYNNISVGELDISQIPVKPVNASFFETEFADQVLILSNTGETYEKFAQEFINADELNPINLYIVGTAAIKGSFALGPLNTKGIPVDNKVSLVGLDGLNQVYVRNISIDGEIYNALQLSINTEIENPGITDVQLQNFTLNMADSVSGTILGRVPIDVLALQPGSNKLTLNGLAFSLFSVYIKSYCNSIVLSF